MATLEELMQEVWPEAKPDDTSLVKRCTRYVKMDLEELNNDALLTLVGQNIGLEFLLPRAMLLLEQNPWFEAALYDGDLLSSLLRHIEEPILDKYKDRLVSMTKLAVVTARPEYLESVTQKFKEFLGLPPTPIR